MTAKEAIEVLSEIYMHVTVDSLEATIMVERHNKALDMAIEALNAQDMTLYMNLPEVSAEEAVEILKRNNRIELISNDKDTNVPSKDCIDRAEAQTAIQFAARRYTVAHEAHGEGHVVWSDNLISVTDAMNALREVPSAQPERPKGEWINISDGLFEIAKCDQCGRTMDSRDNFCPRCGSDMRGEQNE